MSLLRCIRNVILSGTTFIFHTGLPKLQMRTFHPHVRQAGLYRARFYLNLSLPQGMFPIVYQNRGVPPK